MMGMGGGKKVGTGYVPIKPDTEGFGNDLKSGLLSEGQVGARQAGEQLSSTMRGAFVAGVATMGKSVFEFANFDTGMREVFTLLPDISGEAMDAMESQVKDFSAEFGVLPTETVPALYEALGAGVPQDNVFAFLETAQKLARGGATDLATAVDGLSSVTNAYGSDIIDAAEASDIMFKIVGLGKGTVDEVAASLFNVTPVAAALGVSFEDVGASLALLTAQGTPVSVATTQMRSLFAELGKEGTKASKVFEDAAGTTFVDFIAAGGDVQGALAIMDKAAEDSGSSLIDMFGSIEAGSAALGLMKGEGEQFVEFTEEMHDAAGSTEAAFNVMNEGIGASMDRMKARLSVAFINLGEQLAPSVEAIVNVFAGLLDVFAAMPGPMQTFIILGGTVTAGIIGFAGPILRAVKVFGMLGKAMSLLAANPWVLVAIGLIAVTFLIIKHWDAVKEWFEGFFDFIGEAMEFVEGAFNILVHGDFTGLGFGIFEDSEIAAWLFDLRANILDLVGFFETTWGSINSTVTGATTTMTSTVTNAFNTLAGIVSTTWGGIQAVISGVVGFITSIPSKIGSAFTTLGNVISRPFTTAFAAIKTSWNATVGGYGFNVPGWIPGVGGKAFRIPSMATGGVLADPTLFLGGEYPGAGRDPEIVTPQSMMRDTVLDALSTAGSGGPTIEAHLHVDNLTEPATFRRYLELMSTELTRVVQREMDRNRDAKGLARGGINV